MCYILLSVNAQQELTLDAGLPGRREQGTVHVVSKAFVQVNWLAHVLTVFFFARSPEAPRTTMTVFSLSSMVPLYIRISLSAHN